VTDSEKWSAEKQGVDAKAVYGYTNVRRRKPKIKYINVKFFGVGCNSLPVVMP